MAAQSREGEQKVLPSSSPSLSLLTTNYNSHILRRRRHVRGFFCGIRSNGFQQNIHFPVDQLVNYCDTDLPTHAQRSLFAKQTPPLEAPRYKRQQPTILPTLCSRPTTSNETAVIAQCPLAAPLELEAPLTQHHQPLTPHHQHPPPLSRTQEPHSVQNPSKKTPGQKKTTLHPPPTPSCHAAAEEMAAKPILATLPPHKS